MMPTMMYYAMSHKEPLISDLPVWAQYLFAIIIIVLSIILLVLFSHILYVGLKDIISDIKERRRGDE